MHLASLHCAYRHVISRDYEGMIEFDWVLMFTNLFVYMFCLYEEDGVGLL